MAETDESTLSYRDPGLGRVFSQLKQQGEGRNYLAGSPTEAYDGRNVGLMVEA